MKHSTAAAVAGLIGFAVMGLEVTAVRLLAPHFGDTAYVWTNVIGVILLALALGAFLGGRMADSEAGSSRVATLLVIAGVLTAIAPIVARPLGAWLVPADLPLDSAMWALVRGSFVATTILFAPPVILVACVSPVLITLLAREDGKVGRAAGLVSCAATVGSLAGTFAATHLLVPNLGSRGTVWVCAGFLIGSSFMCRTRLSGVAALVCLPVLPFLVPMTIKGPGPGEKLITEVESSYQFLQVVEVEGSDPLQTKLKINEGLDSFHSVAYAGTPYTQGGYYDFHVPAPYLAGDGEVPADLSVLSLGEAAGSFGRLFAHVYPECTMDRVEIDPMVTELGEEFFPGSRPEGRQFPVDARTFVENTGDRYHVVLVDAYEHQIYIPSHLASVEFFTAVANVLHEGGVVSVNCGGTQFDDPVIRALGSTLATVFEEAMVFRVPRSRNFVLMARKGRAIEPVVLAGVSTDDPQLETILTRMGQEDAWRRCSTDEVVLRDDRPYLDQLQEESYSRGQESSELLAIGGSQPVEQVLEVVAEHRSRGQNEDALALLQTAAEATALVRNQAGDLRWLLRDPEGALLEYAEAQRLAEAQGLGLWPSLDENIAGVREELAGRIKAWDVAARNGWLALGLGSVLLVGVFVTWFRSTR